MLLNYILVVVLVIVVVGVAGMVVCYAFGGEIERERERVREREKERPFRWSCFSIHTRICCPTRGENFLFILVNITYFCLMNENVPNKAGGDGDGGGGGGGEGMGGEWKVENKPFSRPSE